ncbi:GIY-YIG nuclease family protein [Candidatus Woesebacteria bacterium]|nr:GIY-YIG nuclease family protein [Candidatus Woesebacteria bacterium]
MFYIYVLQSEKDKHFYTGFTDNIKERLIKHNTGSVKSTKNRRPYKLIYFEMSLNKKDALHREKYLKSSWGKRYLKNRLQYYLASHS